MVSLAKKCRLLGLLFLFCWTLGAGTLAAQSAGNAGTIQGTVKDPSGSVIPGATVQIHNPVSEYDRTTTTDAAGTFRFTNVPFNPYHLTVEAKGFAPYVHDVGVRALIAVTLDIELQLPTQSQTVMVEGEPSDLLETTPVAHTDIDRALFNRVPVESASSSLSSVITLATPAVAADSNGLFHPLGEHAEVSYSIDGQPITDQQSKVFSNQLPVKAIQSMEAISGIAPAEYGDKTSLVVRVVTRSGLGQRPPTGDVSFDYGSFGTTNASLQLAWGTDKWGNFLSATGMDSGRFLDPPEFNALHAHGNSQNLFDRVDYQANASDSFHANLGYTRSWFQIPNTFDQELAGQDQHQLMQTFNIAPSWTHVFGPSALFSLDAFLRQDRVHYFPSADPFSDQPATLAQTRHLTNGGFRANLSYVKGMHNLKGGVEYAHYWLLEDFNTGLTDPTFNAVCLDPNGNPLADPTPTDPVACATLGPGFTENPDFLAGLLPFDLTRGGSLLAFRGSHGINELGLFLQDEITAGAWVFNLGLRGDVYRGLSSGNAVEPRLGVAYNIKKTNTVLRLGYGRFFETPYNENLILSSATGLGGLGVGGIGAFGESPILPGHRNQYTAGFQQAFGKYLVVDGQYFWKYTDNAYDFDILFNTPLAFPIMWQKSKIDGFGIRFNLPETHGFTAYSVLGHTRSRFFGPETGGIIFNSPTAAGVFRIDHDQGFQQTTHVQYQMKGGPWVGLSWRYDSGLVAGAVPDFATALTFNADQQAAIGLFCGDLRATLTSPLTAAACAGQSPQGAARLRIPAPGTENDDTNPPRIAPRHLFDLAVGMDNLFHGDKYRWSLRFTVINLTNKVALYNFLSTFSGTHFVTPRSYTGEVAFHF